MVARNPNEEQSVVDAMDTNQDKRISSLELEHAVRTGHVADASRAPAVLPPGRSSARFFIGLASSHVGMMSNLREVKVAALEPSVATASFGVQPVSVGSQSRAPHG